MNAQQIRGLYHQYVANLPKWRRPVVGYISAIPILLCTFFLAVFLQQVLQRFIFPATFLLFALLLVALVWGTGPALFMLVVGIMLLHYFFIPILDQIDLRNDDIVQVIPLFVIGVIILLVIRQREQSCMKVRAVSEQLERYAGELEAVNSRLEHENRQKESFLSTASHELKNPVTTIRGYSQYLQRRLAKQSTVMDIQDLAPAFQRIDEQTSRLTFLIDQLLGVHAFRTPKTPLRRRVYDLNELCQSIIGDQCLLTGRDVVFFPLNEPLELPMDVDRMTQVVVNLVSNALKYSPQDRPVEVCVGRNAECALLQVKDYGYGIAPDELSQIFDPFYRTPKARSSEASGLGLGLAICKDIIDQHGGRIWCKSELGAGTTFCVELPLSQEI